MYDVLHLLVGLDEDAIRTTAELRWRPATGMLVLVSAWWVKGPLLVAAGWASDLRHRRVVPLVALAATVSFALAAWMNAIVKALVGRSRPPDEIGLHAATTVPGSPSFPSGHSMSAYAIATAIALLAPRDAMARPGPRRAHRVLAGGQRDGDARAGGAQCAVRARGDVAGALGAAGVRIDDQGDVPGGRRDGPRPARRADEREAGVESG